MPDGATPTATRAATTDAPARGGILPDPVDVRDRTYEPTLAPLARELMPCPELIAALRDDRSPWGLPRLQGDEGTCGGHALAAMIDLERLRAGVPEREKVSARMIYWTAHLKAEAAAAGNGISLRDVIKGFYNYGVCRDALWPYQPGDTASEITFERARDARNIALGAYYRLRPNLNTYHAALHETGAVLVSAELHDGWSHARVRANGGEIVPPDPNAPQGALGLEKHAFAIVGYTARGFLVLNSWGRDWGHWTAPRTLLQTPLQTPADARGQPVPGLALWRYEDWANTILDGWVLRLGVGAAEAFEYSIGDQGLGFGLDAPVRSTPVHAILGHFLHLDDGRYVRQGAYVSTQLTLSETLRLLKTDGDGAQVYKGALLTFAGSLLGIREATEQIARQKRIVRAKGWYPFTVLWSVDYVEQARAVLDGVFTEALTRAGKPGGRLDRIIEERAHGVGRAFWRDIGCAAETAARPGGPLHDLTRAAVELLAHRPAFGLRIVAESEGALALTALVRVLLTEPFRAEAAAFFEMLHSVDLIAPPVSAAEYAALALYLNAGWGPDRPDRQVRVHLPKARDERLLGVPPYGRSYFELVRRAFQCREGLEAEPADIPAPARGKPAIASKWDDWRAAPRTLLVPIAWPRNRPQDAANKPINQLDLLYRSDVAGRLEAILRRRAPARGRTTPPLA